MSAKQHGAGKKFREHTERVIFGSFGCLSNDVEGSARQEGLWPLTADHWQVVAFVRTYYAATGQAPPIVHIGRATGLRLRKMQELFPGGILKQAFRLGGMEPPPEIHSPCPMVDWTFRDGESENQGGER